MNLPGVVVVMQVSFKVSADGDKHNLKKESCKFDTKMVRVSYRQRDTSRHNDNVLAR